MTEQFVIAPAGSRPLWLLVPVGLVLIGTFAVLFLSLYASQAARFEVSPEGIRLRGDIYGRSIPAAQVHVAEARRVDLARDRGLLPRSRSFGTGMPGYQSGWFRLVNGEKALVYLTDRSRAVYVPTSAGYSLLLSPADPDGFLAAVKRLAPGS